MDKEMPTKKKMSTTTAMDSDSNNMVNGGTYTPPHHAHAIKRVIQMVSGATRPRKRGQ